MYSDTLDINFSFGIPVRRAALFSVNEFDVPVRPMDAKGLRENKDRHKHLVDGNFDTYIQNMSKATGSRNSWATKVELCATSETYDCEIYIFAKAGTVEK